MGNNLTFSLNSQSISKLKFNDSTADSKYNFSNTKFVIGYKHSLYSNFTQRDGYLKFTQINVLPSLQIGKMNFGHDNLNRTLINFKLGLSGMFHTSTKNTFLFVVNAFANEDEYTLPDAIFRYSGMMMYTRKVNPKFSYRAGLTFTYLFGEPLVLPVLGFKYKTSEKSMLNVTLPFVINWKKQTKVKKLFYGFTFRPSGGINRYQNKLSVDTTNVTLMLRQRNYQFLGDIRIVNKTNMILFQAGIIGNQKVMFTNENNNTIENNFSFNGSNAVYANVIFIWFLNKKPRNNNESKAINSNESINDYELLDDAW
ncbi:MAG: DUF6268 family outer membrane beta-barrel protein [Bacteroidia bacterium]|nr:DUF6268 family outer membrane beta-barrel protein [Bacteroidia bacterium]